MPLAESQWSELLDPILRGSFEQAYSRRTPVVPLLYNIMTSANSDEQMLGVGAIGIDAWDNYERAGQIPEVDFDKGYLKTFTHVEKIVDFSIERKLVDDNKYPAILNIAERMGDSAAVKRENDGASVFNNAFSASYLGADGVALCSASHPYSPSKSGTVQSNTSTRALTKDNVAQTRIDMMAYTDDNGNKVGVTPNAIVVPPALQDKAIEITQSLLDPTSSNNAVNPQAGRFQIIPWHYLSDSNNWFMVDTALMKQSLIWFDRVPLSVYMREGDDRTVKAYWRSYMRYSYGWTDFRWVFGNNVT